MSPVVSAISSIFGGGGAAKAAKKQAAQFAAERRIAAQEKIDAENKSRALLAGQVEDRATGRASTILTGGRGLLDDDTTAKRFLL